MDIQRRVSELERATNTAPGQASPLPADDDFLGWAELHHRCLNSAVQEAEWEKHIHWEKFGFPPGFQPRSAEPLPEGIEAAVATLAAAVATGDQGEAEKALSDPVVVRVFDAIQERARASIAKMRAEAERNRMRP